MPNSGSRTSYRRNHDALKRQQPKRRKLDETPEHISDSDEDELGKIHGRGKLNRPADSVQVRVERSQQKPKPRPQTFGNNKTMTPEYSSVEKLMASNGYGREVKGKRNEPIPQCLPTMSNGSPDQLAAGPWTPLKPNVALPNILVSETTANGTGLSSRYFREQRTPIIEDLTGSIADIDELDHTAKFQAATRTHNLEDGRSPGAMALKNEPAQQSTSGRRPTRRTGALRELELDPSSFRSDDQRMEILETSLDESTPTTKLRRNRPEEGPFSVRWFATDQAPQGKQGDFSLAYDTSRQCLDLCVESSIIEEDWMSIKAVRQMRCGRNQDQTKLLINLSKRESKPTVIFMECDSHRTFSGLVLLINEQGGPELQKIPSDKLEKMFTRFQRHRPSITSQIDVPDDVKFIIEKKRRQEAETHLQTGDEPKNKRPKLRTKLKDRLNGGTDPGATYGQPEPTQFREIPGRVTRKSHRHTEGAEDSVTRHTSIDELLKTTNIRIPSPKRAGLRSRNTRNPVVKDPDTDMVGELLERPRHSKVHGLGKEWKRPLTFPKEGKRRATVEFSDLPKLDEDQCLNDNLIEFYLRYLIHTLEIDQPETAKSVYFFNTYFFSTLKGASAKINYDGVKKWTRNVDLFTHDFIVVPINENFHWYVAIICNLPNLTRKVPPVTVDSDAEVSTAGGDQLDPQLKVQDELLVQRAEVERPEPQASLDIFSDSIVVDSGGPLQQEAEKTRESFSDMRIDDGNRDPSTNSPKETTLVDSILDKDSEKAETNSPAQLVEIRVPKRNDEKSDQQIEVKTEFPSPSKITKDNSSHRKGRRKSSHPPKTIDPDLPAIITLDSLGFSHPPAIKALKQYLCEEASEKRGGMAIEPNQIKGMTAKGIPQQSNFSDCGLYLLGYMDKFTTNPREFVTKLLQKEYNEVTDWPQLQPSNMRGSVRELIQLLHRRQEDEHADKRKKLPRASDAGFETGLEEGCQAKTSSNAFDPMTAHPNEPQPGVPNQDEEEKLAEETSPSEQHSNPARQSALESALPLGMPSTKDELAELKVKHPAALETPRQSASPGTNAETIYIVPDSQEDENSERNDAKPPDVDQHNPSGPSIPSIAAMKEDVPHIEQVKERDGSHLPTPQRLPPRDLTRESLQSPAPKKKSRSSKVYPSGEDDKWMRELEKEAKKGKNESMEVIDLDDA
ncbi:hypothetical protein MMC10_007468 [Thelotrema lepadinum]|nr:hypothetical protein [Thelotrema lepadinum]